MDERIKKTVANAAIIIVLSLLFFIAGTWWRMQSQFQLGEAAFTMGDFTGALAGYESAIHMYLPFHPTIEKAAQKLWQLGETAERQGDVNRALIAYRALRSAFYADRWLAQPGKDWIVRCDQKIAGLVPLQRER
ncbi:MAG: tetratricopeptide repeat protein [Oryzomonas sp.]|jgi:tetratricopeptide (TPR) repeat protein